MNIILKKYKSIKINNVFQQHAFINMRIVASVCVILPRIHREILYIRSPRKKQTNKKQNKNNKKKSSYLNHPVLVLD